MEEIIPTVSVIIPSYNHVNYIEQAISSVLEQEPGSYKIDLIVIDDGSSDGSVEAIEAIRVATSGAFRFIAKQNEGLCKTLNRAIRDYACGDYVAILASDDMWDLSKVRRQLDCLLANPACRLTYCNATTFGPDHISRPAQRVQFSGSVKHFLTLYNFIPAGTVMYQRRLFDQIGGYDENGLKLEDWDFLLRAADATKFCYLKDALLDYRIHENSAMARMRANGTLFDEKLRVMQKNKRILNPFLRVLSLCVHYIQGRLAQRAARYKS